MSVYYVKKEERYKLKKITEGLNETMIWTCLQGHMGKAYTDNLENPKSVMMVVNDFCFFLGQPSEELVRNRKAIDVDFIIMVSDSEKWNEIIEKVYAHKFKRVTRYAIKKENGIFDKDKLQKAVNSMGKDYELKRIDEKIYSEVRKERWSADLCSHYKDAKDFCNNGIGFVILKDGQIVSGASSYTYYDDGIEIEIDTNEKYRRQGLAYICGAKLILECLNNNIYPSWDAQNMYSVKLAEKLGYHFSHEYPAYEIMR